jgi:hypothetical protein
MKSFAEAQREKARDEGANGGIAFEAAIAVAPLSMRNQSVAFFRGSD